MRNTRGFSDSRDRALGDVKNELEHSRGDLRKSLSHPLSLKVLEAQPQGLTEKHTHVQVPAPVLLLSSCCSRPGPWELCTEEGWQEPSRWLLIQTQHTEKCWLQTAEREDAVVPC